MEANTEAGGVDDSRRPEPECPYLEPPSMKFHVALACYGVIALLAWLTLDGKMQWVVWIFLAGLAVKSYLVTLRKP